MVNLFYNRYVPHVAPPKAQDVESKDASLEDLPKKKKKRKRDVDSDALEKVSSGVSDINLSVSQIKEAKQPKKQNMQSPSEGPLVEISREIPGPSEADDGTKSIKKRKKEKNIRLVDYSEIRVHVEANDGSTIPHEHKPAVESVELKAKKGKRKKEQQGPLESSVPDKGSVVPSQANEATSDQRGLSKHKKIKTKFEKSAETSTRLVHKPDVPEDPFKADQEPGAASPTETHGLVPLPQPEDDSPLSAELPFSALPRWMEEPVVASSSHVVPFKDLGLHANTVSSLSAKGYDGAFAIQSTVLPMLLQGPKAYDGDICISAATGSGKTLAYCLPMVENLQEKPVRLLRGLIVVPTRELVTQVRETLKICITGTSLQIGTAVGSKTLKEEQEILIRKGQRYDPRGWYEMKKKARTEEEDLMDWDWDSKKKNLHDISECLIDYVPEYTSSVDILICTPGRLVDHMNSTKGFTLDDVQWLIVDEADRLLDESFQQWVDVVVPALEKQPSLDPLVQRVMDTFRMRQARKVRKIILSATMTKDIGKLMTLKLRRPRLVVLEYDRTVQGLPDASNPKTSAVQAIIELPETLTEIAIPISNVEEKPLYLVHYLSQDETLQLPQAPDVHHKGSPPTLDDFNDTDSISSSSDESSDESSSGASLSSPSPSSQLSPSPQPSSRSTKHNPKTHHGTLIFTKSNESALRLTKLLTLLRPSWASHISALTKSTATSTGRRILSSLRKGSLSIIIASDRASRGLDIPDLAQVVNYDMPGSLISYVHRAGRTARAGREGRAVTFVGGHEARWFWNEIARSAQIKRGAGKKVGRVDYKQNVLSDGDREDYEVALRRLGEAARGRERR